MTVEIYWTIATISSGILTLFVLMSFIGFDIDHFHMDGLDFMGDSFSITSLIAFACIGGWTGYFANTMTEMSEWVVLSTAAALGLAAYIGSIFVMKRLKKWESKGNIQMENAIGKTGKVYLGIPARMSGKGQVELIIQGRLTIVDAFTNQDAIETGTEVIIYDVKGNDVFVEPFKQI